MHVQDRLISKYKFTDRPTRAAVHAGPELLCLTSSHHTFTSTVSSTYSLQESPVADGYLVQSVCA